jgi:hypothetical protein
VGSEMCIRDRLYPDKDTAAAAVPAAAAAERPAAAVPVAHPEAVPATAAYWSKKFDKPVSYCNPLTPLLVLNADNHYTEVLVGDKVVWIINKDWLELKKIR